MPFNIETDVLVAVIEAGGQILAALIAAIAAGLIGKQFADRKRLMARIALAQQDILFLLEVEKNYGIRIQHHEDSTLKNTVRQEVRAETGLAWSGKNTRSRI